jgi:hypothetical protein
MTLIGLLLLSASARADAVLFVSSHARAESLSLALEVELRGYAVHAGFRNSGEARTALERAAMAQRMARNAGARAAVWIEPGAFAAPAAARIRAVGTAVHDEHIVEAPLPAALEDIDARAFAQIASSLVLELMGIERVEMPAASSISYMVPMPPWWRLKTVASARQKRRQAAQSFPLLRRWLSWERT